MSTAKDTSDRQRQFALWLTDQAQAQFVSDTPETELLLQLVGNREFLQHVEAMGTSAAEHGGSLSNLLATALERIGSLGNETLANTDAPAQRDLLDRLVQLQSGTVQSLIRGYMSIVPITTAPANRETLLDNTIRALDKINSVINSSLELDEVLQATVTSVADLLQVPEVTIYLYDEAIDRLILSGTRAFEQTAVGHTTLAIGEGIIGWAAQAGQPVAVRDAWNDPRFKYVPGIGEESLRSFLAVPIVLFTVDRLIGVLNELALNFATSPTKRFGSLK